MYQPEIHQLVNKLRPILPCLVYSVIVLSPQSQRIADDALWKSLQGLRGILLMCLNIRILKKIDKLLDQGGIDKNRNMYKMAHTMRIAAGACVLEALLLKCFPGLPLPRGAARFSLDHYAEVTAFMRAKLENGEDLCLYGFDAMI